MARENREQWEHALTLLNKMHEASMTADVSACQEVDQWEQALTLLHKMRGTGLTADVISLNAAISTHEKEKHLEQLFVLAREKEGHWKQELAQLHQNVDVERMPFIGIGATWHQCKPPGLANCSQNH